MALSQISNLEIALSQRNHSRNGVITNKQSGNGVITNKQSGNGVFKNKLSGNGGVTIKHSGNRVNTFFAISTQTRCSSQCVYLTGVIDYIFGSVCLISGQCQYFQALIYK